MNIAVITAGGIGARMSSEIPKQFMSVNDKPIIVYTLEAFQRHPQIDEIMVICLEGWDAILRSYAKQYQITKLKHVVTGGANGQASIRNGAFAAEKYYAPDDILLIHDSIRPLVSQDIISDSIVKCHQYGSAVAAVPCNTATLRCFDGYSSDEIIVREELSIAQTPHAIFLKTLCDMHRDALDKGITNSVATCTLMVELGKTVYFSVGAETNIKLTTADDMKLFKALLSLKETSKE